MNDYEKSLNDLMKQLSEKGQAKVEKMNDEEEKNGIVFLGDSITDFCDLDTYYPGLNAVNRGIAGDMTVGVLRRMEASVFALEPRLVVLLIGVNDLSRGCSAEDIVGVVAITSVQAQAQ